MNTVTLKNEEKLSKSKVFKLMNDFNDAVIINPAGQVITDKTKDKRVKVIQSVTKSLQKFHWAFKAPLKDYGDSVVLIGNELAINYMIEETMFFIEKLNEFYDALKNIEGVQNVKAITAVQELSPYYKNTFKLTQNKLKDALFEDILIYSEEYGFSDVEPKAYAVSLLKAMKTK